MTDNFFEIENVSFAAGGKNKVNNVNLSIKKEGDIVCVLGPSGIGKTTILRTIAGLEKINKGKIFLKNNYLLKITTLNLKIEIFLYRFKKIVYFHITQLKKILSLDLIENLQKKRN